MQELKHRPGCFGTLAGFITFSLMGGLGYMLDSYLGRYAGLFSLVGLLAAIAVGIGVARKARWAVTLSGLFLLVAGAALTIFIMVDFGSSLLHGESRMPGAGEAYGQAVAILLAAGMAMAVIGVYLIRGKSIAKLLE